MLPPSLRHIDPRVRLLACVVVTIVVLLLSGCGGDDSSTMEDRAASTTTTVAGTASLPFPCDEQLVALANSEDAKAGAAAGAFPPETEAAFDALDAQCGDELESLSDDEFGQLMERIDPAVAALLAEGEATSFEKTGDTIGN